MSCHEGRLFYLVLFLLGAALVVAFRRWRLDAGWAAIGVILAGAGLIGYLFSECAMSSP